VKDEQESGGKRWRNKLRRNGKRKEKNNKRK
jgi:hypothetical protein